MTKSLADRRPIVRLAFSRSEVALSIGVSAGSVDQMVEEGVLPPPRKWHSRKLWLVSEVEAYLNELPIDGEGQSTRRFGDRLGEASWEPKSEPVKGSGGYVIITDPDHPLKKHYDQLGFDPAAMGQDDMSRLMAAAEARWKQSILGTPLGKRERSVLEQLARHGAGVMVDFRTIKNCGPDTSDRLAARGFIEIRHQKANPDRLAGYILTNSGLKAWQAIASKER